MLVPRPVVDGPVNPLPSTPLPIADPYVIYRELGYDKPTDSFYFTRQDGIVKWTSLAQHFPNGVNALLENIDKYNDLPVQPVNPSHYEFGNMGIAVRYPSLIILSLKRCANWEFGGVHDSNYCSISLGDIGTTDYTNNFYKVMHVDDSGKIFDQVPPGCKLVAFAVDPLIVPPASADRYNMQHFNIHIHNHDRSGVELKIDPDIRYPGNSGLDAGDDPPLPIVTLPAPPAAAPAAD